MADGCEAIDALGQRTTNLAVRDWILKKYPGTNVSSISCHIIVCTVNHESRVHYAYNRIPRLSHSEYDFLFRIGRGELERYDPARHGRWAIEKAADGRLRVTQVTMESGDPGHPAVERHAQMTEIESLEQPQRDDSCGQFAMESHLRDYLAQNLRLIEDGLELYVDEETDAAGVEFVTPLGRIDLLAVDTAGGFVVVEFKVSRGSDVVFGQIARYMAWVERHLAKGNRVRGFIVANNITENLRYAASRDPAVRLMEYEIEFRVKPVTEPLEPGF